MQRSCKKLDIKLIEGEYNYEGWLKAVKGYENEPEKGARCDLCFDNRLENTAKKAKELGEKSITSTLLTSPKKSIDQLRFVGKEIQKKYGVKFVAPDFRSKGGTQEQFALSRKNKLYHQDYCGCIYALSAQREEQNRLADELFSPISAQIQPESIEDRIELYTKRDDFEERGIDYKIIREKFLNFRLLRAWVKQDKEIISSYFLPYSLIKRKFIKTRVDYEIKDIYFTRHENIRLISLSHFNKLLDKDYQNIQDIIKNPPSFDDELSARNKIIKNIYSLSPIIVLKDIVSDAKFSIYLDSKVYEDTREHLVRLG